MPLAEPQNHSIKVAVAAMHFQLPLQLALTFELKGRRGAFDTIVLTLYYKRHGTVLGAVVEIEMTAAF